MVMRLGKIMAVLSEACRSVGVSLMPLVVESLGGCSEEASETICRVGHLLGQRTGAPCQLRQPSSSSITLWKGNASLWLQCLPTYSSWVVGHSRPSPFLIFPYQLVFAISSLCLSLFCCYQLGKKSKKKEF